MFTTETPVAQKGQKQHQTTPSAAVPHSAGYLQAHSSNPLASMNDSLPPLKTPPRTPRRSGGLSDGLSAPPTEANGYTSNDAVVPRNSSAKSKGKIIGRPKSVATAPASYRTAQATPPLPGTQSAGFPKPRKTPGSVAYAGPTFHASPAPSALPLPSFFSKTVLESAAPVGSAKVDTSSDSGDSPSPPALQKDGTSCTRKESPLDLLLNARRGERAKGDTSSDSGDSPSAPDFQKDGTSCQREESPLDVLFNACRAERARAMANASSSGAGSCQPPFGSPLANETTPHITRAHSTHFVGGNASSMFGMELEGTYHPGKPLGAPFAAPYSERIKAARSSSSQSQPTRSTLQNPPSVAKSSQALRNYLFTASPLPSRPSNANVAPASTYSPSRSSTPARHPNRSYHTEFPFGNESIMQNRNTSRTSGLQQRVSQTKTPPPNIDISDRITSAPPKMSTNPFSVNNQKLATSAPIQKGFVSEQSKSAYLLDLEERLRRDLKLEPVAQGPDSAFHFASLNAAPGYRAPSMNGAYSGVVGS